MNNEGIYLVKLASKDASTVDPFYKCISHTTEGIEFKFDFTDPEHCFKCIPKLLATDHDGDGKSDADEAAEATEKFSLKSRDEKSIAK